MGEQVEQPDSGERRNGVYTREQRQLIAGGGRLSCTAHSSLAHTWKRSLDCEKARQLIEMVDEDIVFCE